MRRDTGGFHTTLDTVAATGWVTAAVAAAVLLAIAALHINLDQPSPTDDFMIGGAFVAPLLGFGLLYRFLLERIAFYWALDRNLKALLHQVEWEIAEAHKYHRLPYHVTGLCNLAVRLAPEHATTKQIQSLAQEASRQSPAADGTGARKEVYERLRRAFFSGGSWLDRGGQALWIVSLLVLCASAASSAPPNILLAVAALHWGSLIIVLRRESVVVALLGSFLLTVLILVFVSKR